MNLRKVNFFRLINIKYWIEIDNFSNEFPSADNITRRLKRLV